MEVGLSLGFLSCPKALVQDRSTTAPQGSEQLCALSACLTAALHDLYHVTAVADLLPT